MDGEDMGGTADQQGDRTGTPPDDKQVMDLLSEHVPLSLIMDLTAPAGPDSESILDDEGEPEDEWWEQPQQPAGEQPDQQA